MTIYITKNIDVEVRDYETEIELDESEILGEMDSDTVLRFVQDHYDVDTILDGIDADDVANYLTKMHNKKNLAVLLRKVADYLDCE